jgi:aminoglycoside phosphotransferase family enzyme/predicted kinase
VQVVQTHISVVFLVGEDVYKLKKPLDLGFIDCSTLEKRLHLCQEEVRLNRRLAPGVYRGVLPVTREADGRLRVQGQGQVVDHVVWMRRVPWEATLEHRLDNGLIQEQHIQALARRLARFHQSARRSPEIAQGGAWEVVQGNCLENFAQTRGAIGELVSPEVFARVQRATEALLLEHRALIQRRCDQQRPCDTHGDLRLEHVYLFPERPAPDDIVVIDCVEFNARFRHADPVADLAFLGMELLARKERGLAQALADAWFEATGDDQGRALWPLYLAYRAVVRAKVDGIRALEPEVPQASREQARRRAQARWLLALSTLEPPARRPCLILTAGLPAAGKSTLSRGLAEQAGLHVLRSDELRKELAGLDPLEDAGDGWNQGLYTPAWSQRTYRALLEQARGRLLKGQRVLVDAGFRRLSRREPFLEAAAQLGVPTLQIACQASPETTRARLEARSGDASDADWSVYQRAAQRWQPLQGPGTLTLSTEAGAPDPLRASLEALRSRGLL